MVSYDHAMIEYSEFSIMRNLNVNNNNFYHVNATIGNRTAGDNVGELVTTPGSILTNVMVLIVLLSIEATTLVGNLLVVIAVLTTKTLNTVTNSFIMSLAVADMLVAIFVMPFSIYTVIYNEWKFGNITCDLWISCDVMLCTASILNLCCISLDRYFAITRPLSYSRQRSPKLARTMIALVWISSVLISCPPVFGWKDKNRDEKTCSLNLLLSYRIYSSMGSFFVPCFIMCFVYLRIFKVIHDREKYLMKSTSHTTTFSIPDKNALKTSNTSSKCLCCITRPVKLKQNANGMEAKLTTTNNTSTAATRKPTAQNESKSSVPASKKVKHNLFKRLLFRQNNHKNDETAPANSIQMNSLADKTDNNHIPASQQTAPQPQPLIESNKSSQRLSLSSKNDHHTHDNDDDDDEDFMNILNLNDPNDDTTDLESPRNFSSVVNAKDESRANVTKLATAQKSSNNRLNQLNDSATNQFKTSLNESTTKSLQPSVEKPFKSESNLETKTGASVKTVAESPPPGNKHSFNRKKSSVSSVNLTYLSRNKSGKFYPNKQSIHRHRSNRDFNNNDDVNDDDDESTITHTKSIRRRRSKISIDFKFLKTKSKSINTELPRKNSDEMLPDCEPDSVTCVKHAHQASMQRRRDSKFSKRISHKAKANQLVARKLATYDSNININQNLSLVATVTFTPNNKNKYSSCLTINKNGSISSANSNNNNYNNNNINKTTNISPSNTNNNSTNNYFNINRENSNGLKNLKDSSEHFNDVKMRPTNIYNSAKAVSKKANNNHSIISKSSSYSSNNTLSIPGRKKLTGGVSGKSGGVNSSNNNQEQMRLIKESKAAKTLAIVVGGFVVSWMPFFIMYVLEAILPRGAISKALFDWLTWLGYFNSAINPIIYAFYSKQFRSAFYRLTIGKCSSKNKHENKNKTMFYTNNVYYSMNHQNNNNHNHTNYNHLNTNFSYYNSNNYNNNLKRKTIAFYRNN